MRAAVFHGVGKPLVVEEVNVDEPGPGEIKVRLGATAICHSDIHFFDGDVPSRSLPGIAGHECAGIVEEIGEGVSSVKAGDHVVMAPITGGCGRCMNCMLGYRNMCQGVPRPGPHHKTLAGEPIVPLAGPVGGLAEYTVVHEFQTAKIPDDLPMHVACLLGCGVLTGFGAVVNRAQVKPFQSVAVIGVGGVGLNAVQGAAFSGAHPVIGVDLIEGKLEASKQFGATHTVNGSNGDVVDGVKAVTDGRGVDFAFITVGASQAVRQAVSMLGPRGTAVVVGISSGDMSEFRSSEFISERMLTGSMLGSTRLQLDVPRYVDIYRAGRLKLDELVTACYPLDEVNEAVESSKAGEALRNVISF